MSIFARVSMPPSPATNRIGHTALALALALGLLAPTATALPQNNADDSILLWQQAVLSRNSSQLHAAAKSVTKLPPLQLTPNSLTALALLMDAATTRFPHTETELARNALQNLLPAALAVPTTPANSQHLATIALRLARFRLLQDQSTQANNCLHIADVLLERAAATQPDANRSRLLTTHYTETARLLALTGITTQALQRLEQARILLLNNPQPAAELAELATIAATLSDLDPLPKFQLLESLLFSPTNAPLILPEPSRCPKLPNSLLLPSLPKHIRERWFIPASHSAANNTPTNSDTPPTPSQNHNQPILPLAELVKSAVASNQATRLEQRLNTLVAHGNAPARLARLMLQLELNHPTQAAEDALQLLERSRTPAALELQLDQQLLWTLQHYNQTHWLLNHTALTTLPAQSLLLAEQASRNSPTILPDNALIWCEDPEFGHNTDPSLQPAVVSPDGLLIHHTTRGSANCLLPWPVNGPLTLSLRTLLAPALQAGSGFDGFAGFTAATSDRSLVAGLGSQPSLSRTGRFQQPNAFGWQAVRLNHSTACFSVNGHPLWHMPLETTSFPWLMLHIDGPGLGVFSQLQIADTVTVPREVSLSADASLRGWTAHRYGQLLPLSRRLPAVNPATPESRTTRNADWVAADDTITGRSTDDLGSARDIYPLTTLAFLQYQRPLQQGERLQWEYEFPPDSNGDCLALGSVAIRVRPDGVFLHGIPASPTDWTLFPPDRESRSGQPPAESLPVRHGWNTASLRIEPLKAVLSINGQQVLELPLEPLADTRPGLCFHRSQPPVKVRHMTLSGDWPELFTNTQLQELLRQHSADTRTAKAHGTEADQQPHSTSSPAANPAALANEWVQQQRAAEVLQQPLPTSPDTRWQQLTDWVFPTTTPGQLRTVGTLVASTPDAAPQPQIDSPLQELIRLAIGANKLPVLEDRLLSLQSTSPEARMQCTAALALSAVMARSPQAQQRLEELLNTPPLAGEISYWPLLAICEEAQSQPEFTSLLLKLLETAPCRTLTEPTFPQNTHPSPQTFAASLRSRLQHSADSPADTPNAPADHNAQLPPNSPAATLRTWQLVAPAPNFGSSVLPASSACIALKNGAAILAPRTADNTLINPKPLLGDFILELRVKVAAEDAVATHQLPLPGFGGRCWQATAKGPASELPWRDLSTDIPLTQATPTATRRLRLERHGMELQLTLDDQPVLQHTLTGREPPWLALRCGQVPGAIIEELRLSDLSPAADAPTTILLPFTTELAGWDRPTFSHQSMFRPERQTEADWRMNEARLTGNLHSESAGTWRPSHLRFLPPLPEQGRISWSFQYKPDTALVHPTIGNTVLLLEPGVAVFAGELRHLANARHELSRTTVLAACTPIEGSVCNLSADAWQQASLEVNHSELTLLLNGSPAATLPLHNHPDRRFGFFHWSDQTSADIRSLQLELPQQPK